jgi:chemotaxis protein MotB
MSARRRRSTHANHERWLVSYADFITLLFAFFVVLYSSSQADKHKMGQLAAAIESAFSKLGAMPGSSSGGAPQTGSATGQPPANLSRLATNPSTSPVSDQRLDELRRSVEQALAREIQQRSVAVNQGPEGLVVSLREMGFYNSGSAELRSDAQPALTRIAELLRNQECRIRIEGHTDNVPIHTSKFNSNWELSTARATAMIREMVTVHGLDPGRLSAAGYGEFHPIASNATEEGRGLNRRIDIVILSGPPKPGENR